MKFDIKRRSLFVFAGQSNMMGAGVYPPKEQIYYRDSYEYLHKSRRMGKVCGEFKSYGFPVGEYSYRNLEEAYERTDDPTEKSSLAGWEKQAFFVPSMSNLKDDQKKSEINNDKFSERDVIPGPSLAPYLVQAWESTGQNCAYTHIAKGGVPIVHYFTEEMQEEYNRDIKQYNLEHGENYPILDLQDFGAGEYFREKALAFFEESESRFPVEDTETRVFFWLQGESDVHTGYYPYKLCMEILWDRLKKMGFTHFFCIRVNYWGEPELIDILKAQENFCKENEGAYMVTRVASFFPWPNQKEELWFAEKPPEEYRQYRDCYYGFHNPHINEKGFQMIAEHILPNMVRILVDGEEPILEEELVKNMED